HAHPDLVRAGYRRVDLDEFQLPASLGDLDGADRCHSASPNRPSPPYARRPTGTIALPPREKKQWTVTAGTPRCRPQSVRKARRAALSGSAHPSAGGHLGSRPAKASTIS